MSPYSQFRHDLAGQRIAGVVLEHAALHEIARVLQEQEVIDGEATTRPTPPIFGRFWGMPQQGLQAYSPDRIAVRRHPRSRG